MLNLEVLMTSIISPNKISFLFLLATLLVIGTSASRFCSEYKCSVLISLTKAIFPKFLRYALTAFLVLLCFGGSAMALDLQDEALAIRNENGEIIGFIGRNTALRLGTSGKSGRIFLFPSDAADIFNEGQSSIRMNADGTSMTLRSEGDDSFIFLDGDDDDGSSQLTIEKGDINLRNGSLRVSREGNLIGFIGQGGGLRLGTDGATGKFFLFPSDAADIFNEGQSSIRMNADGTSMTLRSEGDDSFIFLDGDDDDGSSQLSLQNGTINILESGGISFPDGSFQKTAIEQGPRGPQGPQGPMGPPGRAGGEPFSACSASSSTSCGFSCGSNSTLLSAQAAPCSVGLPNGQAGCSVQGASGVCCVCQ